MFKTIVHNIIHKNTINQKHKSVRRYPHSCSTGISCTGTIYAPRGEEHNGVDSYTMAIKIHPLIITLQCKTQMTATYLEIAIRIHSYFKKEQAVTTGIVYKLTD